MTRWMFSLVLLSGLSLDSAAHADIAPFSTASWCLDSATVCWSQSDFVPGFRFVADPGLLVVLSGDDEIRRDTLLQPQAGLELSLFRAWASAHLFLIAPFSLKLSENSRVRLKNYGVRQLEVVGGFGVGISALDSMVSIGYASLLYERSQFRSSAGEDSLPSWPGTHVVYVTANLFSVVRAVVKHAKPPPTPTTTSAP